MVVSGLGYGAQASGDQSRVEDIYWGKIIKQSCKLHYINLLTTTYGEWTPILYIVIVTLMTRGGLQFSCHSPQIPKQNKNNTTL